MKKEPKFANAASSAQFKKRMMILCGVLGVVLLLLLGLILFLHLSAENSYIPTTEPTEESVTEAPTKETEPSEEPTGEPTEPPTVPPEMLEKFVKLYEQNPDLAGWIRIDDTIIDYPVMYSPADPEKYLHMDFDQKYSYAGLPFIHGDCSIDPESDNLIIHGHNMRNGTMFKSLHKYAEKSYWEEHPEIYFSNLYEERTYKIVAAFYDRVYYKNEDVFKFYQFIDAEDEDAFNEAVEYYKSKSLYDTGVVPEYGDHFLTLVTCSYHHEFGRFVVIAVVEDAEEVPEYPEDVPNA